MAKKRSHGEMKGAPPSRPPPPPPRVKGQVVTVDATGDLARVDEQMKTDPFSDKPLPPPPSVASGTDAARQFSSFKSTAKEVTELGSQLLNKWNKKAYEAKRLETQGFRAAPKIRTPLNMLVGMRKKNEQRTEKRLQRERDSGLQVKRVKKEKREHRMGEDIGGVDRRRGPLVIRQYTANRINSRQRSMSAAKRMRQ